MAAAQWGCPARYPARGAPPGSARPAPRAGASRPPSGRALPWSLGSGDDSGQCGRSNQALTAPETLNQRQALRLAAALQAGFGEVIRTALEESKADNPQTQWQLLLPILIEAETPPPETPKPRPGCPRRVARPRPGLTIRREQTRDGYSLHFTGRDASSWLMDDVFGDIERMYGVG